LSDFPRNSGIPEDKIEKLKIGAKYFCRLVKELENKFDIDLVFCNDRYEAEAFVYNIAKTLEGKLTL
jgi:hypothetical protein